MTEPMHAPIGHKTPSLATINRLLVPIFFARARGVARPCRWARVLGSHHPDDFNLLISQRKPGQRKPWRPEYLRCGQIWLDGLDFSLWAYIFNILNKEYNLSFFLISSHFHVVLCRALSSNKKVYLLGNLRYSTCCIENMLTLTKCTISLIYIDDVLVL